jgi:hypothetical protein
VVVNVTVKRRDIRTRHVGIRETNANAPPITHRNTTQTTSEPALPARAGRSTEAIYLLAVRCPVYRGRDSSLGFLTELENLVCDAKGKGTSGSPARPKVPKRKPGVDCSVVAVKRLTAVEQREQVTRVVIEQSQRATGRTRRSRRKAAVFDGWHEP